MTPEYHKNATEIIKAYIDGKQVQYVDRDGDTEWHDLDYSQVITWNFERYVYRVKPPKLEELPPIPVIPLELDNMRTLARDTLEMLVKVTERPASQVYEYRTELEYLKDYMRVIIRNIDLLEGKKDATTIPM